MLFIGKICLNQRIFKRMDFLILTGLNPFKRNSQNSLIFQKKRKKGGNVIFLVLPSKIFVYT